jgi:hypothetical protein
MARFHHNSLDLICNFTPDSICHLILIISILNPRLIVCYHSCDYLLFNFDLKSSEHYQMVMVLVNWRTTELESERAAMRICSPGRFDPGSAVVTVNEREKVCEQRLTLSF